MSVTSTVARFAAWRPLAAPRAESLALLLAEERLRLALWLPVALGVGSLWYFARLTEPGPAWHWAWLPPAVLAFWLRPRHPLLAWGGALLACVLLGHGLAAWQAARQPAALDLPRGAVLASGLVERVERLPEGLRVTLAEPRFDGGEPQPRRIRVRLRNTDEAQPHPGDRLEVRALVRGPAPPAYPGAWDFQRAAWFSGLGGSGFALGPARLEEGGGPPPLAGLRATIEARVLATLPGAAGAIAVALLTGGQSAIPEPALEAMRDSGLAHLLSVSGLHIAIVMGVSFSVARLLLALVPWLALRLPGKTVAGVLALGVGGAYMLLCGAEVPMQRSFAMAALATLGLLTGRRAITLRAWALAAGAVLLVQPAAILGPSFQMSFAAVLALVAGWKALRPLTTRLGGGGKDWRRRLLVAAFGLVGTSVLAGLATTPYGLFHFGRLQLFGVAANAVAVPITSVLVMPAGMAAVALMPLGLEQLALAPMGWGVTAVLWVAHTVAAWPGAALAVPPIPGWGLACLSAGLLWLCLWQRRWRLWGLPLVLAGIASCWMTRPPDLLVSADGRLVAARTGAGVAWQRLAGASSLARDSWLRLWAARGAEALPREGEALAGAARCTPGLCWLSLGGAEVALLRGALPAAACGRAALVVSSEPVRGRCAAPVVDRFSVWRDGAHAVWVRDGAPVVLSDRADRGARPWVPPRPRPRQSAEPPAPTE